MGSLGMQEMIGLFVIALLLFGPKKLPELGRTLGKALTEFRRAKNELQNTFQTHLNELEKETRIEPAKEFTPATYSYPYDDYGRYEEPVASVATSETVEPKQLEQPHLAEEAQAPVSAPGVAGTIPRANGVQPVTQNHATPTDVASERTHPTGIADQEHSS